MPASARIFDPVCGGKYPWGTIRIPHRPQRPPGHRGLLPRRLADLGMSVSRKICDAFLPVPKPVIASRHRRRSNPYSRGNPSLWSVPRDSFVPPGARYFCLQRQKYPKTPLRNYVSKDFLSRYAHPCSNHSPRDCANPALIARRGNCRCVYIRSSTAPQGHLPWQPLILRGPGLARSAL